MAYCILCNKDPCECECIAYGPHLALVYQCGIANVFRIGEDSPRRILQHDFRACENFCRGAMAMGARVEVYHADVAGDVRLIGWAKGPGEMFKDKKRPPREGA